jgi:peptidoglycan/LPS O-acetylase OafA/YrhL
MESMPNIIEQFVNLLVRFLNSTFWAGGGLHPGVIIFIVLSGFCIHLPQAMHPERQERGGFWKYYAWRRFMRIAPLYWFAISLGVASLVLANLLSHGQGAEMGYPVWHPLKVLLTYTFLSGFSSPFVDGSVLGNGIMATVTVEAALYVLYPFILSFRLRTGWPGVFALSGILYAFAAALAYVGFNPTSTERSLFAFFFYWWLGAFAVELLAQARAKNNLGFWKWWLVIGSFGVFLLFSHNVHFKGSHYLKSLMLAGNAALLLYVWVGSENKGGLPIGRLRKGMAWLGERSYSLYAVHFPIITITTGLFTISGVRSWFPNHLVSLAAVLAVTFLSYKYIEYPSHQIAKSYFQSPHP